MPESQGMKVGQYELLHELGRGGMGIVYAAKDLITGRLVALKLLAPAFMVDEHALARFRREACTTANLHHPGIVCVFHVGVYANHPYYVMEHIEGISMAQLIKTLRTGTPVRLGATILTVTRTSQGGSQESPPDGAPESTQSASAQSRQATTPPALFTAGQAPLDNLDPSPFLPMDRAYHDFAARVILQCAEALAHAHRQGVIHRDIKPANILLGRDGAAHLSDFGLARASDETSLTLTNALVGTPRYMSPEQLGLHEHDTDQRSDLYALGVTLYEILTLQVPFGSPTRDRLLLQIANRDAIPPRHLNPRVPRDLQTIIEKAMEKRPEDRYQTAQQMCADLQRFLSGQPILTVPPTILQSVWRAARRHRTAVLAAVLAVSLLVPAAVGVTWGVQRLRQKAIRANELAGLRRLTNEAEASGDLEGALTVYRTLYTLNPDNQVLAAEARRLEEKQATENLRKEQHLLAENAVAEAQISLKRAQEMALKLHSEIGPTLMQLKKTLIGYLPADFAGIPRDELGRRRRTQQAEYDDLYRMAKQARNQGLRRLQDALVHVPDYGPARRLLAATYLSLALQAEADYHWSQAEKLAKVAAAYDDGTLTDLLHGAARVSLTTTAPGATCRLYRYEDTAGVLEPRLVDMEQPLRLPISRLSLPPGSYLGLIEHPDYRVVRLPFLLTHCDIETLHVPFLSPDLLPDDLLYIPAGRCALGHRQLVSSHSPQRPVLDAFLLARTEVTCGQYAAFLNALAGTSPNAAARHVPVAVRDGKRLWHLAADGTYRVSVPADTPVHGVSGLSAQAYCSWLRETTGFSYRLPTSREWEKAARGADGRLFPWGNRESATFAVCRGNTTSPETPVEPARGGTFPRDCSPFGVFDMAGNVAEICADVLDTEGNWTLRGGHFEDNFRKSVLLHRGVSKPDQALAKQGFRVACDLPALTP